MAVLPTPPVEKYARTKHGRPLKTRIRVYTRALTDILLVLLWLPAALTGVLLWQPLGVVPDSPGRGEKIMLWGLTTREWGDIHWWICVAAVAVTVLHVALDFKAFKGAVGYVISARRHEA
ncbi:MAG: DUF4405 domain-containing protein [Chloroflexi bacterium]|nr:DUF4405 domain-containing protein [Chloroflexota bacterium]